jgi:Fic family protein
VADEDDVRHSRAIEASLITDLDEVAVAEARNGLRQIDEVTAMVEHYVSEKRPFFLRPSTLLHLHRIALDGLSSYAGLFRPAAIEIGGSRHQPVDAFLVPSKVEEMCDYVNDNWGIATPIHLSAYVLWRLNWIHPFTDGNGRTARACSYLILCLKLGFPIYAPNSVPAQIAENKKPYYAALEAADAAFSNGAVDTSKLEGLIETLLARQLWGVMTKAKAIESEPK